ncbi:MAG TPA: hypothetical protein VGZ02_02425 [Candidatus Baltobacteraceae bacterium]|nr:hypothetical protein [Candidatus Baltobacteraceae bacterium]
MNQPKRSFLSTAAAVLAILCCVARGHAATETFSASVPLLPSPPHMDGVIDDSWSKAAKLPVLFDFTYQRPGEPATVYVAQDPNGIDLAFDVQQREQITATQNTNGAGVMNDDNVSVVFWPQGTKGFQYTFTANASGARDQTSSENSAFSPQWTAGARRTPAGYVVTMHIPFDVMRNGGSHDWSVQFQRQTIATNSTEVWEHIAGQRNAQDPANAGVLTGIAPTAQAAVKPQPRLQVYGLGEMTPQWNGGSTSRIGADLSVPVTATSSLIATFHPDYSNVEVDQQTIAPTAFARQYNEIRPFFTQAASNFNSHLSCTNCPTTLYTPNIPTFRDGYAYEGTLGNLSWGAFDAVGYQGRTDSAETANYAYTSPGTAYQVSLQRVSVDYPGFRDNTTTVSTGVVNQRTHFFIYLNGGGDTGTDVTDPGFAQYWEYGGGYVDKNTTAGITLQKIGPQFVPADGYVQQPGIAGYLGFFNRTFNFSPKATLQDIKFNGTVGRYNDPSGNLAQTDNGAQVNFDFKDQLSLHVFNETQGVETSFAPIELLPFNANGFYISYRGQTSTPTSIQYTSGPYSHGHLTAWSYITTLPLMHRLNLSLETDENLYGGSHLVGDASAKQWLERASVDWQFTREASFDLGARRIIGANLPNAFQAPDLPNPRLNGFLPFDYVNAGNVSAAFHFLASKNEFYVVYGNPNYLSTQPALYVKWIRYVGAEKGV